MCGASRGIHVARLLFVFQFRHLAVPPTRHELEGKPLFSPAPEWSVRVLTRRGEWKHENAEFELP